MYPFPKKLMLLSLIGITVFSNNLLASGWYRQTTISTQIEADDNKRLRSENEKGVVGANARVDIKLSNVTEISEVYIRGALRSIRYDGDDDRAVDTDDQLLFAGGRWNGERSQFNIDGEFTRQSSQFTEFDDSGFFDEVNRRVDKSLNSRYLYTLTEKSQVFIGGNYTEVDFPNSVPVSLTEYSVEGVNAGVVYTFNEKNSVTLTAFNSNYEADPSTREVETTGGNIRYDKVLNEIWSSYIGVGARKSNFKNESQTTTVRDDDTGSSFELGATRAAEKSTLSFSAQNSLEPSADGDVNERTELNFDYLRPITSRLSTRFTLNWFKDESINNDAEEDREFWTAAIFANYRVTPKWYLTGQIRHREQQTDSDIDNRDAESDAVIIGVRYNGNNERF